MIIPRNEFEPLSGYTELRDLDPDSRGLPTDGIRAYRAAKSAESTTVRTRGAKDTAHGAKKSFRARCGNFFSRGQVLWPLQTAAWIGSLLFFAATIAVLWVTHNHPQPDWTMWNRSITISAILSVLGTVSTMLIMVPITASLGQLKWIRFQKGPRPLSELELIDQASRGLMGSAVLLWKRRGGLLVSLGAFVVMRVVFNNPFLQLIVHYDPHWPPGGTAVVPIATQCEPAIHLLPGAKDVVVETEYDPGIMQGLYAAGFGSIGEDYPVTPTCATANCTWDLYWTLGLCASCGNTTANLTYHVHGDSGTHLLPNGFRLEDGASSINISNFVVYNDTEFTSPFDSVLYKGASFRVADFFVIYRSDISNTPIRPAQSWECMLQFCARQYNATMLGSNFTEVKHDQFLNTTSSAAQLYIGGNDVWSGDLYLAPPDMNTTLRIGQSTASYFNVVFDHIFQPANSESDLVQRVYNASEYGVLEEFMHSVADSIGRNFRTQNVICLDVGQVTGTAYRQVSYTRVEWPWIAMPAAIQLLAFIFYVAALVVTRRSELEVWKGSGLPGYFHGLAGHATEDSLNDIEDMEEAAKNLTVGLKHKGDDGPWKLM